MSWIALALSCKAPPPPSAPRTLEIAAINDFHGALYETPSSEPGRAAGGLPWLVAAMRALRQDHPELLVLDGGDVFQGSWPVNQSHGLAAVEAMNLLGLDASAVGNHEFDYGPGADPESGLRGAFEAAAREADFAWLSANVRTQDGERWAPRGVAATKVIDRAGVRVGIIGLTTRDTPMTTRGSSVADLSFGSVVDAVREVLPDLEREGAEVIIVVGHLTGKCETTGFTEVDPNCRPDGEIGELLTQLEPGTIDAMVLGHAHTFLQGRVDDTFLLEQRDKGRVIGRATLVVGADGVEPDHSTVGPAWLLEHPRVDPGCTAAPFPLEPILVGDRLLRPADDAVALVRSWEAKAGTLCAEVGCASRYLGRSREKGSEVGNLVTDAMRAILPKAQVALTNSGGLRDDVRPGTVRAEDLQKVMPFDNRMLLVEMTGANLLMTLRIGSSGAHGVLQVSGATYGYDPAKAGGSDLDGDGQVATWENDRMCGATVDGRPIDPAATYRVALTDFLWNGGDHLDVALKGAKLVEEGPLLRDALIAWAPTHAGCFGEAEPIQRIIVGPCP